MIQPEKRGNPTVVDMSDWVSTDKKEQARLEMESYNYCTTGYKHVLISGFPFSSGKYFVVLQEDRMLFLAELIIGESGNRTWSVLKTGAVLQESQIRMWKLINV